MGRINDSAFVESPRVTYDCGEHGTAVMVRVCPHCGRFVKADETISVNGLGEIFQLPNSTCTQHGRVHMLEEGYL